MDKGIKIGPSVPFDGVAEDGGGHGTQPLENPLRHCLP